MLNVGDSVQIAGCSTKKRLLETSSGCSSFDTLLGGGLINSSIVLIDEYRSRCYGSYLTRAFLADGVHHNHRCFIADPLECPRKSIVDKIPSRKSPGEETEKTTPPTLESDADMKIAWRYGNLQKVSSSIGPPSGVENAYDYSKHMENPSVEVYNAEFFSFSGLYKRLCEVVKENDVHVKTTGRGSTKKNLLRVVIKNIDSDIWEDSESLGRFLLLLRTLTRSSYMIVYLVANSYGTENEAWRTIETYADTQVHIKQFNNEEKKTFRHLGSVHGYFYLKSLPRLLSVGTYTPPILDLIFEASSRKGLLIRVMHLPCLLDNTTPTKGPSTLSCQKIDF